LKSRLKTGFGVMDGNRSLAVESASWSAGVCSRMGRVFSAAASRRTPHQQPRGTGLTEAGYKISCSRGLHPITPKPSLSQLGLNAKVATHSRSSHKSDDLPSQGCLM
jgi:hypothetical protein